VAADNDAGGTDHSGTAYDEAQNESWANWDQQTADQDATTAQGYADSGNSADAGIYSAAADTEQSNADTAGEAGEYGAELAQTDPSSEVATDTPVDEAPAEEAPVDDTPAEEAPVDDSAAVDDDSSAS
jgi:hypothetical protein